MADIASNIEGWVTAVGTGLAGLAAAGALVAGWIQFQRSGFTFSVRVLADGTHTRLLVTIANKGRLPGYIAAVRVETPFPRSQRTKMKKVGAAYRVVPATAAPHAAGSRADTLPDEVALRDLTRDIEPGGVFVFRIDLPQAIDLKTIRVMVKFGDGRFVRKRPQESSLSLIATPERPDDAAPQTPPPQPVAEVTAGVGYAPAESGTEEVDPRR